MTLSDAVAHLSPHRWARANRLLIRKALAEFTHERLITPEASGDGTYVVRSDDGALLRLECATFVYTREPYA